MYPILCPGGYGVPIKKGKMEVCGIDLKVTASSGDFQVSLFDTNRGVSLNIADKKSSDALFAHVFGGSTSLVPPFLPFPEPIKMRNGISIGDIDNIDPGQIFVYIR